MQTFAIGDIHGCFRTLERLLLRLDFDETRDRLWLVGDLVNRGPGSLEVLRWAKSTGEALGNRFAVVLGNHDTHLLAVERGWADLRRKDTLEELLAAPDCGELVAWLAERPLLHREGNFVLVHAGVLPHWTIEVAETWARRVESRLRQGDEEAGALFRRADAGADVKDLLWQAFGALTRLRALTPQNDFCNYTGPPDETPVGCAPWFQRPDRRTQSLTMVVGHWAAMGLRLEPGLIALDSGCFWGGQLSAIRLEDGVVFQQENKDL